LEGVTSTQTPVGGDPPAPELDDAVVVDVELELPLVVDAPPAVDALLAVDDDAPAMPPLPVLVDDEAAVSPPVAPEAETAPPP
jgi:hypothetical protein